MFTPVYLDYNATTPVDVAVLEAMQPYFSNRFGNPSSRHEYGRQALHALAVAREQVAAAVGAHPTEVIFTSGGSEASNLFLKGAGGSFRSLANTAPKTVAIGATEHPCGLNAARQLRAEGWQLVELPVDQQGRITSETVTAVATRHRPARWSVMLANNETGVVQDVTALAAHAEAAAPDMGWFHVDAVQAFGKLPVNFRALSAAGVHAITVSSHKIYGPKGAAALVVDRRMDIMPQIAGGGQEGGLRAGTENIAAIVGFGVAAEQAAARLADFGARLRPLRDRLEEGLKPLGATIFGTQAERLDNTSFFAFPNIDGETLVSKLDRKGFALASGSACSSANADPSHVLLAMGIPAPLARGAVRVSLGDATMATHIDGLLAAIRETLARFTDLQSHLSTLPLSLS
jgi:cysteine desulfurase